MVAEAVGAVVPTRDDLAPVRLGAESSPRNVAVRFRDVAWLNSEDRITSVFGAVACCGPFVVVIWAIVCGVVKQPVWSALWRQPQAR